MGEITAERARALEAALRHGVPVLQWAAKNRRKCGPIGTLALTCLHELRELDRLSRAPAPAEAPTTPTVEASTRCLRCNGSGIGQETMLCIRCGGSGEDPRRQSSQQTVKPAEARAPRAPDLVTAEGRTATATTATIRVQKARIAALEAKNEKLRERTAELEDGLRPFAKAGELFPPRTPDSFNEGVYRPAAGDEYAISGDDLRRARALFQGHGGADG